MKIANYENLLLFYECKSNAYHIPAINIKMHTKLHLLVHTYVWAAATVGRSLLAADSRANKNGHCGTARVGGPTAPTKAAVARERRLFTQ